jgi:hypothetical protein
VARGRVVGPRGGCPRPGLLGVRHARRSEIRDRRRWRVVGGGAGVSRRGGSPPLPPWAGRNKRDGSGWFLPV